MQKDISTICELINSEFEKASPKVFDMNLLSKLIQKTKNHSHHKQFEIFTTGIAHENVFLLLLLKFEQVQSNWEKKNGVYGVLIENRRDFWEYFLSTSSGKTGLDLLLELLRKTIQQNIESCITDYMPVYGQRSCKRATKCHF